MSSANTTKLSSHRVGLSKLFRFEAAHHLPNYVGKCANVHGHSYRLRVQISAAIESSDKAGIVVDFDVLKAVVNRAVVERYDHQDLNVYFPQPTAERMVVQMYEDIASELRTLAPNARLDRVRLWETETCFAEYPAAASDAVVVFTSLSDDMPF